jgi:DNA uptake protein ComE-like DNA-binding protein
VLRMCTVCHSTDQFTSRRATPDEWSSTVQMMVSRGAEGSDQDIAAVIKYLSTNFGPPPAQQPAAPAAPAPAKPVTPAPAAPPTSHLNINTAGPHALLASLTLTPREAQALIHYRSAKGNFTRWQQVAAVPGISAAKIASKRQLITF